MTVTVTEYGGRERVLRVECKSLPTELEWVGTEDPGSPFHAYCIARAKKQDALPAIIDDPCAHT